MVLNPPSCELDRSWACLHEGGISSSIGFCAVGVANVIAIMNNLPKAQAMNAVQGEKS